MCITKHVYYKTCVLQSMCTTKPVYYKMLRRAYLHLVVCMQIFACPVYEAMDTPWGRSNEGTWSMWNVSQRFVTRTFYMVLTTFVAALLPFFGDFIALTGSLSVLPLDFVLVLAMTMKVIGFSVQHCHSLSDYVP